MMYRLKGPVPEEEYTIPLGVADIKREGSDITIIATSSMVQVALGAASLLAKRAASAPKWSIRARSGRWMKRRWSNRRGRLRA